MALGECSTTSGISAAQIRNRKRFYERAVKKKVSPKPPKKFLAASTQHTRRHSMLIITPLIDRLFLPLFEPDSNSRSLGQFLKLPTMVLFATPAAAAGPMTISGYAWGHIVATGP